MLLSLKGEGEMLLSLKGGGDEEVLPLIARSSIHIPHSKLHVCTPPAASSKEGNPIPARSLNAARKKKKQRTKYGSRPILSGKSQA